VFSTLIHGPEGHPLHPPLTDVAIGAYTAATMLCVLSAFGVDEHRLATAWWLVLLVGLGGGALAALSGLAEWLTIERGTAVWRIATMHMVVMVVATVIFLLDAILGYHRGYTSGEIAPVALSLTIVGFLVLAVGGWFGGSIVFVHGTRVTATAGSGSQHGHADLDAPPRPGRPPAGS
jgi:uncharacterized membrane protein